WVKTCRATSRSRPKRARRSGYRIISACNRPRFTSKGRHPRLRVSPSFLTRVLLAFHKRPEMDEVGGLPLEGLVDDAAAQTAFAVVKNHRLSRGNRPLGLCKADQPAAIRSGKDGYLLIRLPVAELGGAGEGGPGWLFADPMHVGGHQPVGIEGGMIAPLFHVQDIFLQVFSHHEPGLSGAGAADAQPAPLSQGVVHEPVVAPLVLAGEGPHLPRLGGQVLAQKLLDIPLADKTDARAVLFLGRGQ